MSRLFLISFGSCIIFLACSGATGQDLPADATATPETVNLHRNLKKVLDRGTLFGHQDDLAYGVGWKYENGRSDIKEVTGDYPAVYGWELGGLELDQPVNLDSVPFDQMQAFIRQGYARGGVITISWHLHNPLTGKSAWDPAAGTVAAILPGGSEHALFKTWLDKVAAFMRGLKGEKGEPIPVIFRPYHELNGDWFWWGGRHCTPDQFKQLWRFTVSYLRDEQQLHHLLYAYNTDRYASREEYLLKYPGDEWVDVIGFDIYQRNNSNAQFVTDIGNMLTMLETMAAEKKKIPALTEFGGNLADSQWWTGVFGPVLARHRVSWVLGWRNAGHKPGGESEFYVPYRGQASAADFVKFYRDQKTLFQQEISKEKLYQ